MTIRYTGLIKLETGRDEDVLEVPVGATVADALVLVAGKLRQPRERALAGYFIVRDAPGERPRSLGPASLGEELADGTHLTLLYRFAGG